MRVEAVVLARHLDQSGAHALGSALQPGGQLGGEEARQPVVPPVEFRRIVVDRLVEPGGRDQVDPGRPGQPGQRVGASPHPGRRPLDERPAAGGREAPQHRLGGGGIVQLLPRQPGAPQEEVVVGVADAELGRIEVAEHGADAAAGVVHSAAPPVRGASGAVAPSSPSSSASSASVNTAAATRSPARALGTPA